MIKPKELETSERGEALWALFHAAVANEVGTIRRLIRNDPSLVHAEYWYTQPLHFAVREGNLEAAQALLAAGADPTFIRYGGENLAVVARDRGHDAVASLIDEAIIRATGGQPEDHEIHTASAASDLVTVRRLLTADSTLVHGRNAAGATPLHLAVPTGSIELVGVLLDAGADIEALQGGGDPYGGGTYSCDRFKPIDLAIWTSQFWGERKDWKMVDYLLARGADCTLTIAAAIGDTVRVRHLLDSDPGLVTRAHPCGRNALSTAIQFGHFEIASLLLNNGADPNRPEGRYAPLGAALFFATRHENTELCRLLLEKGANPASYIDSSGSALTNTRDKTLRTLLYRYGATMDAFSYLWEDNVDAIAVMAALDPETVGQSGCGGAFAAVVSKGDWDLLYLLLARGVRVPTVLTSCRTYLWRQPEMTRILLEHGMDPNLPDWQFRTPLHDLCNVDGKGRADENRLALLDLFLAFGANINAVEVEYHSTPLGWAARNGLQDMVEALLVRGADPRLPGDVPWATPLSWAKKRGHVAVVQQLDHYNSIAH